VDILELTEAIADDGSSRHLPPFGTAATASEPVLSAAISELERLASVVGKADAERARAMLGDRGFDEFVRTELRRLLRAWLDEHLPAIVERLVAAEIAGVADRSPRADRG
jgi:uncharacterized protein